MSKVNVHSRSLTTDTRGARTSAWIAAAWVVGYAVWFYSQTFQYSSPASSRWEVWFRLPELLAANVFAAPGRASGSWANLAQRFDLLAVAAGIWCGAWAVGNLLLRGLRIASRLPQLDGQVFACGLGISAISLITLACGLAGWLSPTCLGGALTGLVLIEIGLRLRQHFVHTRGDSRPARVRNVKPNVTPTPNLTESRTRINAIYRGVGMLVLFLFLLAMLLGSLLPPIDFDVKTYHLTGPKEFFLQGRITFLPHNVYTSFPFLTEMISLLAMVLRQDWFRGALAGQAVLMGFAPLTALALYCAGRRFHRTTGWLAAIIYFTTPWTYRLAVIAYVEGALSCFLCLSLYALVLAAERIRAADGPDQGGVWQLFHLSGLFAGSAMACKYPGLVTVAIPLGIASVVIAARICRTGNTSTQPVTAQIVRHVALVGLAFAAGVTITVGPWLAKNLAETGNPVYPLAYQIFGGRDWDEASDGKWRAAHSPPNFHPGDLLENALDVTVRSNWLSPLLFSLAPLTSLPFLVGNIPPADRRTIVVKPLVVWLWLYVGYLFGAWWFLTHRLDRFWVPLLPVVAWLAAIGATWTSDRPWVVTRNFLVAAATLFNLAFITTSLCGLNSYLSDLDETRIRCEYTAEDIQYVNRLWAEGSLTKHAVVLSIGQAQTFDARMPVIYNTVFDRSIFCEWFANENSLEQSDQTGTWRSLGEIRQKLAAHGVTHVLVNWESLLANRATYGYCNFVSPARLRELQKLGILGDPTRFLQGLRPPEQLPDRVRHELETWGAELLDQEQGRPVYISWQIFPVLPEE